MECPVCFQECPAVRMVCGHSMCRDCLTSWYQKASNKDCPMCRKPICFKGLTKLKESWDAKSWEDKYTESLGTCIDEICEQVFEDGMDVFLPTILGDIDQTFRILRDMGVDPEEIEYLLMEEGLYISARSLKLHWCDEPVTFQEPVWRPAHLLLV